MRAAATVIRFSAQEAAAILAGLRLLQIGVTESTSDADPIVEVDCVADLATDGGRFEMPSADILETLCQRTCGVAGAPYATTLYLALDIAARCM